MMDHHSCRAALLDDRITAEVHSHLDTCAACGRFAEALATLDAGARLLAAGDPPTGLADRVLDRVREDTEGEGPRLEPVRGRPERRMPGLRAGLWRGFATAAAVVALVVGAITVFRDQEQPRRPSPLLIVARSTADEGSAQFDLRIDLSATTRLGKVDTFVARSVANGGGIIQFPDRLEMDLRLRHYAAFRGLYERSRLHRIVIGDRAYQRAPGGEYERTPTGEVREPRGGILNQALFEPTRVLRLLRDADADVIELEPTTLDGQRVRHFLATIPSDLYEPPFETSDDFLWRVELWVGARDDVLRRFNLSGSGTSEADDPIIGSRPFSWRMEIDLELSDFGVPVSITRPRLD